MNNKTASEMFKALGYIPFFTTDRIMAYTNISNIENEEDEGYVFFYLKTTFLHFLKILLDLRKKNISIRFRSTGKYN